MSTTTQLIPPPAAAPRAGKPLLSNLSARATAALLLPEHLPFPPAVSPFPLALTSSPRLMATVLRSPTSRTQPLSPSPSRRASPLAPPTVYSAPDRASQIFRPAPAFLAPTTFASQDSSS